jgi:adhesin/invasin
VTAGGGSVSPTSVITDAAGLATASRWTLGATVGVNTVTATVPGLPSVTFSATGAAGPAVVMAVESGDNQTAQAGRAVALAPTVVVRDAQGNPVVGITVTFAATLGGGTVIGARQVTDAAGTAQVGGWFLGTTPGANTLTATAAGLPSVTFSATSAAGAPVLMIAFSGNNGAAITGTALTAPPTVRVTDASGNPVSGVTVTFVVVSGGGTVTGAQVTFQASAAAVIAIVTPLPPTTATLTATFQVTVQLQTASGASVALAGVPLTIAKATGPGTLVGGGAIQTNANGSVTFAISVTGTAGVHTFSISGAAGLTSPPNVSITINP